MGRKVSFAEYARHRGCSRPAVTYAIQDGRIHSEIDPASGKKVIDLEQADIDWKQNTDPLVRGNPKPAPLEQRPPEPEPSPAPTPPVAVQRPRPARPVASPVPASEDPKESKIPSLTSSRALKEAFAARLAKIEYEEKSGRVVRVLSIRMQAFKTARAVRDAMLAIPAKVSAELAGEKDPFVVHRRLEAEIRQALENLSGDLLNQPEPDLESDEAKRLEAT
jgi:hypothetical protein